MPTILLENVPAEVYERLERRAASRQRSLPEEAVLLLRDALQEERSPIPELIPSEEVSAPCDLPLPDTAVHVKARLVAPPLPDPVD